MTDPMGTCGTDKDELARKKLLKISLEEILGDEEKYQGYDWRQRQAWQMEFDLPSGFGGNQYNGQIYDWGAINYYGQGVFDSHYDQIPFWRPILWNLYKRGIDWSTPGPPLAPFWDEMYWYWMGYQDGS